MILKTVLLLFFILLVAILVSNIKCDIKFFDKLNVKIKFCFFGFNVNDHHPKDSRKKDIVSEKESKNFFGDALKKRGLSGFIDLLKEIANTLTFALKKTLKYIKVDDFNLKIKVVSQDSAATALKYGKICSIVYPLVSIIHANVSVKNSTVEVVPDFENAENSSDTVDFTTSIHISIFRLFIILISTLFYYVRKKEFFK